MNTLRIGPAFDITYQCGANNNHCVHVVSSWNSNCLDVLFNRKKPPCNQLTQLNIISNSYGWCCLVSGLHVYVWMEIAAHSILYNAGITPISNSYGWCCLVSILHVHVWMDGNYRSLYSLYCRYHANAVWTQLILVTCTWAMAFLSLNFHTIVFKWVFFIFNSAQVRFLCYRLLLCALVNLKIQTS